MYRERGNPFNFTDRFDVLRKTEIISNTVTGIGDGSRVAISGGSHSYMVVILHLNPEL